MLVGATPFVLCIHVPLTTFSENKDFILYICEPSVAFTKTKCFGHRIRGMGSTIEDMSDLNPLCSQIASRIRKEGLGWPDPIDHRDRGLTLTSEEVNLLVY